MKRNLLAVIGAVALTWQTGAAADPVAVDAPRKLPEAQTTAPLAGTAPGSVPAWGKEMRSPQPVGAMAAAPAPSVPAAAPASTGLGQPSGVWGDASCCNPCCNQCGHGRIIGGLGLYLIQPYFENNPAFTVTRSSTSAVVEQTDRTDNSHHMDIAPELWLGYMGENGLGARLRWWYFRQGTDKSLSFAASTTADPTIFVESAGPLGFTAFGDNEGPLSIAVTSKLQLQVWDLEGLRQQQIGCWGLLLSGGLRLAHINQHYNAYLSGDSGTVSGPINASVTSGHSFHGVGPTIALEGHYPIADSGLAFFGTARAALLFGSAKQNAVDAFTAGAAATEFATSQDHRTRVMPVCELELGVEYARNVGAGRAFAQVALVGQDWLGAGNASRSTQDNALGIPTGGTIIDNDLGFFGFLFRVGVNY